MRLLWLNLCVLTLLSAACIEQPIEYASIRLVGLDMTGSEINSVAAELVGLDSGKVLQKTRAGILKHVAFGTYLVRAKVTGFYQESRVIHVQQKVLTHRFQLEVGQECHYTSNLVTTVHPTVQGREYWVKVVPVRGIGGAESATDSSGRSILGGLTDGDYFLFVLDGSSILKSQVVRIDRNTSLSIQLATH